MKITTIAAAVAGAALLSGAALPSAAAAAARKTLVVCAPGFPGNTEQAKPSMEAFAKEAASAAGWPAGSLEAIYYETEQGGLARLAGGDAALALVPLPFFIKHARELALTPKLQVVQEKGSTEIWSLVAKKGAIALPSSLKGWEVTGSPGYAPTFIRSLVLAQWGELPPEASITFTPRAVSALRRAAAGEKVAVILDGEQTAALKELPFAADLEVVVRSKELPGTILCTVSSRVDEDAGEKLVSALLGLQKSAQGVEVLKTLRMTRFERVDEAAIAALLKVAVDRPASGR